MYFWWCFYNPMLIVTRNLVIFSLILTRYMFSISKLTGILNIISECDFKHIMALPIKTITTLRLPAILVIMSVSTFNTDVILYLYFYIIKYNWNYYYLFNFSYFKLLWLCVYSTLFSWCLKRKSSKSGCGFLDVCSIDRWSFNSEVTCQTFDLWITCSLHGNFFKPLAPLGKWH